ncbi:MAG: CSLREA domain-containing protein [Dehalococcoidia bacterium]|nr:CSLREA domain-containing protein [Dehalococcoidia bacterium]
MWLRILHHSRLVALLLLTGLVVALPAAHPAYAAAIVVNTFLDANPPVTDGGCTLREAIINANANAATFPDCPAGTSTGDTITFSGDMIITLAAPLSAITNGTGLTVDGAGKSVVVRGPNGGGPVWTVISGAVFTMSGLVIDRIFPASTLPRGIENQGGVVNVVRSTLQRIERPLVNRPGSILTVTDSTIMDNWGSGLLNQGAATVTRSLFFDNRATLTCCAPGVGGAIHNTRDATLLVSNSTLSRNGQGHSVGKVGGFTTMATPT